MEVQNSVYIYWLFSAIIGVLCYKFIFKYWSYFSDNNVKFIRGWPILGAQYRLFFGQESMTDSFRNLYGKFPNEKIFGFYEIFGTPVYMVRDPELIRKITIKDFDHFVNHRFNVNKSVDPLVGRALFFLRDQQWRDMRTTLTPAFTGSKMKLMFSLILKCSENVINEIMKNNEIIYEMKELQSRISCDTIANCAFGLEINSMNDKTNEFFTITRNMTNLDGWKGIKFFLSGSIPKIVKFLGLSIMDEQNSNYLRRIIHDTIRYRQENGIIRMDMINLLMQARQGLLKDVDDGNVNDIGFAVAQEVNDFKNTTNKIQNWEDDDIVGQALIFIVAGLDTVATVMSFATYEIAMNPHVQNKLYEEIENVKHQLNGQPINYECIQKMSYMDMVLSETLRMWHPLPSTERIVTKPYVLEDDTGLKVHLNIGDGIWLPTPGIHMDEKYYPKPEIFDPERFSEINRKNILPFTYFPFGSGPRNCLGSRFALLECKIILYSLLSKFHIDKCERTPNPLRLRKNTSNVDAEGGFWLKFTPH